MTRRLIVVVLCVLLSLVAVSHAFRVSFQRQSTTTATTTSKGFSLLRKINQQHQIYQNTRLYHGGHHGHDHDHDDEEGAHDEEEWDEDEEGSRFGHATALSAFGNVLRPKRNTVRVVLATLLLLLPVVVKRRVTKGNFGLLLVVGATLSLFDTLKGQAKRWVKRITLLRDSLAKHSTPLTRAYFFKNDNAADRVTLLGVVINVFLSITKFAGGIAFNSAVLVADAGHSLSDLFSDFITLWAVQVARLPADEDHPYGHGKFESVGSLFLSLTLMITGLSVGAWSFDKMQGIIAAQKASAAIAAASASSIKTSAATAKLTAAAAAAAATLKLPSWPALFLAAVSIASKEWLFRVTKRVGEALQSQIIVANAWHHRSDAFSSVLSLFSIALAMTMPQLLIADSAAGIFVAGMICLTGVEIMIESIKELTDTSDNSLATKVIAAAKNVEGVVGVKAVRARTVGSGAALVDLTILTEAKLSSSAAHALTERTRWSIQQTFPNVIDVLVRSQGKELFCPLLSSNQRPLGEVEQEVRNVLTNSPSLKASLRSVSRVMVHYVQSLVNVECFIKVDPKLSIFAAANLAKVAREEIMRSDRDVVQAEIYLDLEGVDLDEDCKAVDSSSSSSSGGSSISSSRGGSSSDRSSSKVVGSSWTPGHTILPSGGDIIKPTTANMNEEALPGGKTILVSNPGLFLVAEKRTKKA